MNKHDYFRVMKLTTLFLLLGFLQLSAGSYSQTVTLKGRNLSMLQVLKTLKKQTGYEVLGNTTLLKHSRSVTVKAQNMPLADFLDLIFRDQPLDYRLVDKTILLERKNKAAASAPSGSNDHAPHLILAYAEVHGRVVDSLGKPLQGASVRVINADGQRTALQTRTDHNGYFELKNVPEDATLQITYVGYITQERKAAADMGAIVLKAVPAEIEAVEVVVNTGYQEIPKERATGSFTVITQEQIQRSTGTNILSRLEGITNGLQFNRQNIEGESQDAPRLRVRGLSTIESNEDPLIVVDNFPFHGDINSINPNDIEQITLLKDAAAASIWGAQAGNGVIVIVTKSGKFNQKARFDFNSNVTVGEKPDLFYDQNWLPTEVVMGLQKRLFEKGAYDEISMQQSLLPYVDLLRKKRDNLITLDEFERQEQIFKGADIRRDALEHLYRNSSVQQYSLNARGGSESIRYYFSTAYDQSRSHLIGTQNDRLNLNLQTTFKLMDGLELGTGIWLTNQNSTDNGLSLTGIKRDIANMPYGRLVDETGKALDIPQSVSQLYLEDPTHANLLDWHYRPVDEIKFADNTSNAKEIRLTTHVKYTFLKYFNLLANYQYLQNFGETRNHYSLDSYYARNMINAWTQPDGTYAIPMGGILRTTPLPTTVSHAGRGQLNFQHTFLTDHEVVGLAGLELRQAIRTTLPGSVLYNYNDDVLTASTNLDYTGRYVWRPGDWERVLPAPPSLTSRLTDRDLSYFGNVAYTFKRRYTLSGSARYDGSNLFGVKTNQKGTPLWSLGGSWDISKETFYHVDPISYLRLRTTYGVSGNVNKSVTHYPTMRYMTNSYTNFLIARLLSPGNPSLRWEKVRTFNLGVDFEALNHRVKGSIEFYTKLGDELIGDDFMPPSTGMTTYKINYANIRTTGWDFQFNWENIRPTKPDGFSWGSMLLMSLVKNKVTHFNINETYTYGYYTRAQAAPVVGRSRDVVYALPWHGLSPENGFPIIYMDGEPSMDYRNYMNNLTIDDLLVKGVSVPPFYGSFQNILRWKGLQLDFLLTWKSNYVFRRASMRPGYENYPSFVSYYHQDYLKRWQKPGDELHTNVPGSPYEPDNYMAEAYLNSEVLITKGDHIRLQDIRFSYTIPGSLLRKSRLSNLTVFLYARDLGIVWRANKYGIDPDVPYAQYPAQKTLSFGLNLGF